MERQTPLDPTREIAAETTLELLQRLLPQLGISRLANITGLDDIGIPVWLAIRPSSKYLTVAQGKGLNRTQAKISAIMESVELYHLENIVLESIPGSFNAVTSNKHCLNPEDLNHGFIVNKDIKSKSFNWIPATELISQQTMLIPRELIEMDMTLPANIAHDFRQTTTGVAAGNSLTEATIKSIYEVIERQTLLLWQQGLIKNTHYVPPSIPNPSIQQTIDKITNSGKQVRLYYIENTWAIPVYFCEIIDKDSSRPVGTCIGSGCHHSHLQAILAALLEAIQTRLTLISGSRDDNYQGFYEQRMQSHLIPHETYPKKQLTKDMLNDNHLLQDNANTLQDLLDRLNNQPIKHILRVDHTNDDLQIPVSQIIIPEFGSPL